MTIDCTHSGVVTVVLSMGLWLDVLPTSREVGDNAIYLDGWPHRCTSLQRRFASNSPGRLKRGAEWESAAVFVCRNPREENTATGLVGWNGGGRCKRLQWFYPRQGCWNYCKKPDDDNANNCNYYFYYKRLYF